MIKEKIQLYYDLYVKDKCLTIKSWLRHHLTKRFYNLLITCLHTYPWDYGYMYDLEEAKLKEMIDYHSKSHIVCEESRQQILRTMKLALRMLEIIKNETECFSYDGEIKFTEIEEKDENGEPLYTLNSNEWEYKCLVNVNKRNYKRFNVSELTVNLHPHELYVEKARYLYHKIRYYYEQHWWD